MAGLISPYHGTYVTAESASKDIDAEGIIAAANSVKDELSGLSDLATSYYNTKQEQYNEEARIRDQAAIRQAQSRSSGN